MQRIEAEGIVLQIGWLAGLPTAFGREVLSHCRMVHVDRDNAVYAAGDPPGGMFGLVTGSVRFEISIPGLGAQVGHIAYPGFWFGETAALRNWPRQISAIAGTPASLFYLPIPVVQSLAQDAENLRHVMDLVIDNSMIMLAAARDLMIPQPAARIASRILAVARSAGSTAPSTLDPIRITQSELAMISNMSRKTVNQELKRFEKLGMISLAYGRLTVIDPTRLKKAAEGEP